MVPSKPPLAKCRAFSGEHHFCRQTGKIGKARRNAITVIITGNYKRKKRKSRKEKEVKKLQVTLHKRSKQLTGHLFFAIINAEKGIVTRCVENGRLHREKKRSFYGKNISDRELFLCVI